MTTANLPVRYEITAVGTAAQADLIQICAAVTSEGGFEDGREYHFSANMAVTPTTVGARQMVFAIRPVGTWSPSGVVMRGKITPETFSLRATTNSYLLEVVYAPTITGGTWTAAGTASGVEWDRSGTLSGGYVIHSEYVDVPGAGASARNSVSGDLDFRLPLALDASGSNPIPLALVVTGIGGSVGVLASMDWKENR
jgi:hypothetical protein